MIYLSSIEDESSRKDWHKSLHLTMRIKILSFEKETLDNFDAISDIFPSIKDLETRIALVINDELAITWFILRLQNVLFELIIDISLPIFATNELMIVVPIVFYINLTRILVLNLCFVFHHMEEK